MGSIQETLSLSDKQSILIHDAKGSAISTDPLNDLTEIANALLHDDTIRTIVRVASRAPPENGFFPHCTKAGTTEYEYEPSSWWTSGFFPGSLWLLYERSMTRPLPFSSEHILRLAQNWQLGMEKERQNTSTHDLGFMIMPSFHRDYKFTSNEHSRDIVIQAARSLSTRWNENVQCFRSWDQSINRRLSYNDPSTDFLVIIDNMMNLDLLYTASTLTGDPEFARRATAHANTTMTHQIRSDKSTYHLVNYDPATGAVKARQTVQGYKDSSCWTRGQAWALYGFATAYRFTGNKDFLQTSRQLSDYFCCRVEEVNSDGVVYWDFDAPRPPELWDTSAAMIACSGMILLYQLEGIRDYLPTVFKIIRTCIRKARMTGPDADTILGHATVNNNEDAFKRVMDTGLVYADYYFLEVGNRLLESGLLDEVLGRK